MGKDTTMYSPKEKKIYQEDIVIINIYAPNTEALKFIKETQLQLQSHIDPHTLVVGGINASLLSIHRSHRPKLNKEMLALMDITPADIHRTFHPTTQEYTFSLSHGTFSKIDHSLTHKASLRRYRKTENLPASRQITMH